MKTWEALADGLLDAAILARLEATWPGRSAEQRSQAWIDRQMGKIDAALQAMAHGLGDKPFCSGIHLSLSDIAVGCALGYLNFRFPADRVAHRRTPIWRAWRTSWRCGRVSRTASLVDPPAPRLRRVTPQGAALAARRSRFRGALEELPCRRVSCSPAA